MIPARQRQQKPALTPKQKKVLREIRAVASRFGFDYEDLAQYAVPGRTTSLEVARDKLIKSQIITWYTLADEFLGLELTDHFFDLRRPLKFFRRSKRYKEFQREILEDLSLRQKLRLVRLIWKMPKDLFGTIDKLNTVRNSIAHSYFPQDRLGSKPIYKGKSVLTLDGLLVLNEDLERFFKAIEKRVFSPEKA
jgi:hypothetical protein